MPSVLELADTSGLIFSGTVVEHGTSTLPSLPPSRHLVVVRVDRGLRVDPVLGELRGKLITVLPGTSEEFSPGERAIFFTNSWIHGQGIAVREVAHLNPGEEKRVAKAISELPKLHLLERLRGAALVAYGQVVSISEVERTTFERNAPLWAAAELKVDQVLRGESGTSVTVYFPTSDHPMWSGAPRFKKRQQGVFILRTPSRTKTPSEAALAPDSLVALDPADFQAESQLQHVKSLLGTIK